MAMTNEEKAEQMTKRNEAIVAYYNEGHTQRECASRFRLGRQRIIQVLQKAGVWRPYVKGDRTKFLGINVSEDTKDALTRKAKRDGVSVSKLAAGVLDEAVAE